MKQRTIYTTMTGAGLIGMASAFLQTLEKINLLKNKDAELLCNLNSVLSCSSVLQAWQSSIFGFPNSLLCMMLFTVFTTVVFIAAVSGHLGRGLRLGMQAASIATLLFALWFIWQSIYAIGALCILCLFCLASLLVINWGWLRINISDLPIGVKGRTLIGQWINTGADIFGWIILALLISLAVMLRFSS